MVKNWADHCSSDEEDVGVDDDDQSLDNKDNGLKKEEEEGIQQFVESVEQAQGADAAAATSSQQQQVNGNDATQEPNLETEEPETRRRTYDFPSEPPFTLFVGNLSYSIMESEDLAHRLIELAHTHLGQQVVVTEARIMFDHHNSQRHRGFAYVQLETLDMLKSILELNETPGAYLAGRNIQFDTSTSPRNRNKHGDTRYGRGSSNNISNLPDGSSFRAGKYNQNRPQRNQKQEQSPPRERTSLRLAPRTKPTDSATSAGTSSSIFGSGKARDEQAYEKRKSVKSAGVDSNVTADTNGETPPADSSNAEQATGGGTESTSDPKPEGDSLSRHHAHNDAERRSIPRGRGGGRGVEETDSHRHHGGRGGRGRGRGGRGGDFHHHHHRHSTTIDGGRGSSNKDEYRGHQNNGRGGGRGHYNSHNPERGGGRGRGRRDGSSKQPHNTRRDHRKGGDSPSHQGSQEAVRPSTDLANKNSANQAMDKKVVTQQGGTTGKGGGNMFAALDFDDDSD